MLTWKKITDEFPLDRYVLVKKYELHICKTGDESTVFTYPRIFTSQAECLKSYDENKVSYFWYWKSDFVTTPIGIFDEWADIYNLYERREFTVEDYEKYILNDQSQLPIAEEAKCKLWFD